MKIDMKLVMKLVVALVTLAAGARAEEAATTTLRGDRELGFVENLPMYSPNCLRPSPGGKFPLCDPDDGPPCCIGLTCEVNPKDKSEYRCGNKAENKVGAGNTKKKGGDYDYAHIWSGSNMAAVPGQQPGLIALGRSESSSAAARSQAFHSFLISGSLLAVGLAVIAKVRQQRVSTGFVDDDMDAL